MRLESRRLVQDRSQNPPEPISELTAKKVVRCPRYRAEVGRFWPNKVVPRETLVLNRMEGFFIEWRRWSCVCHMPYFEPSGMSRVMPI